MTVSVLSAGKRLGRTSRWNLTNLHMQKLCYFAHMIFMGQQRRPLVDGHFEAWDFGPVHPELYHCLKIFGAGAVQPHAFEKCLDIPDSEKESKYLDHVVEKLPKHRLIEITHWDHGAWAKNYNPPRKNVPIPDADIIAEYKARVKRAEDRKAARNAGSR